MQGSDPSTPSDSPQTTKIRYEVRLAIYDFSKVNCALSPLGMGLYHTAVQLNDMEFCYCVYDSNPHLSGILVVPLQSAGYSFNRAQKFGHVELSNHELHETMTLLSKTYTCGNYNMLTFNCNHFSDELLSILVGKRLPQWIFRMTGCLKYLCCCLPKRVVSGQWSLDIMKKKKQKKEALLKTSESTLA